MKFKSLIVSVACLAISQLATAQTRTWFFNSGGIKFNANGTTSPQTGSPISAGEGTTVMSDVNGSPLFTTDGTKLYNASNTEIAADLKGGASATQSAIAIPIPTATCNKFIVFTLPGVENNFADGLGISLVTTLPTAPFIARDAPMSLKANNMSEKLAAIADNNGGYWVVAHSYNKTNTSGANIFYKYRVTSSMAALTTTMACSTNLVASVSPASNQAQVVGSNHNDTGLDPFNAQGQMKFSPDGTKLAVCISGSRTVEIFSFDINTGVIGSTPTTLVLGAPGSTQPNLYGLEFSPNSQLLYASECYGLSSATNPRRIFQINLANSTYTPVYTYPSPTLAYHLGGLQIGPNGKIYVANNGQANLLCISNPDNVGSVSITTAPIAGTSNIGLPTLIGQATSCNVTTTSCKCPGVTVGTGTIVSNNTVATSSLPFTLNTNGKIIKQVKATLVNWNTTVNNADCKKYTNLTPADMGSINTASLTLAGFTQKFAGFNSSTPTYTNEVSWTSNIPQALSNVSGTISIRFPGISSLSCCSQTINYAVRFEFYDENCGICEVVKLISINNLGVAGTPVDGNFSVAPGGNGTSEKVSDQSTFAREAAPGGNLQEPVVDVFPNPSNGTFTIRLSNEVEGSFEVVSLAGRKLNSGQISNGETTLKNNLGTGVYTLVVTTKGGKRVTKKIVIEDSK